MNLDSPHIFMVKIWFKNLYKFTFLCINHRSPGHILGRDALRHRPVLNHPVAHRRRRTFFEFFAQFPYTSTNLPHVVTTQHVHFRLRTHYFLLPWKIPEEISRRAITKESIYHIKHDICQIQPFYHVSGLT